MGRRAGNSPFSPGTNPVPNLLQSCPRTAPSLTPRVPMGCRGKKRGDVQLRQSGVTGGKLLSWAQDLDALPTDPMLQAPEGPWTGGASGDQLWVGARGKGLADVPPGRTHTHLSDQTWPASPKLGCNQSPHTQPQGRAPELSWSLGTEAGLAQGQAEGPWDHTVIPRTSSLQPPRTALRAQPHCAAQARLPHPP